jgi:hypothetical protein
LRREVLAECSARQGHRYPFAARACVTGPVLTSAVYEVDRFDG